LDIGFLPGAVDSGEAVVAVGASDKGIEFVEISDCLLLAFTCYSTSFCWHGNE
jgi:hypothetical protein